MGRRWQNAKHHNSFFFSSSFATCIEKYTTRNINYITVIVAWENGYELAKISQRFRAVPSLKFPWGRSSRTLCLGIALSPRPLSCMYIFYSTAWSSRRLAILHMHRTLVAFPPSEPL
jgi:hypothetical protein